MFRYKNDRSVTYYGSYDYQNYDVFNYLKLNFSIFKDIIKSGDKTFVSGVYPFLGLEKYLDMDNVIKKEHYMGRGDLFELISSVVYIHSSLDTNNRIIPEAFYYSKKIKIIEELENIIDSVTPTSLSNGTPSDSVNIDPPVPGSFVLNLKGSSLSLSPA